MFQAKTEKIDLLAKLFPNRITELEELLNSDTKVYIDFATARKVATELNELVSQGLFIYDIQKIKNFICWNKEMDGASKTS